MGRVQTPVLYLLFKRSEERRNFKPKDYVIIKGIFELDGNKYEGILVSDSQKVEGDLEEDLKELEKDSKEKEEKIYTIVTTLKQEEKGRVLEIKKILRKEPSLHLFSLTSLQIFMNARFGWKAAKTLRILQALYERGVS